MKKLFLIVFTLLFSLNLFAWIDIEQREKSITGFPCMKCHDQIKSKKINLPLKKPHQNIEIEHFVNAGDCFFCHDRKDRNKLVLINKSKVSYNQSYMVCTQCHGEKFREWNVNIHGKQIGSWNVGSSTKTYRMSCTACHNAHSPKIKPMKTEPGPPNPYLLRGRKNTLRSGSHSNKGHKSKNSHGESHE